MHSCEVWPRGLKVILWCSACAAIIDFCQIAFYGVQSLATLVGVGTAVAFCLECASVIAGVAARRRAFFVAALVAALFSFLATCYFQIDFIPIAARDIAAGHWPFFGSGITAWYYNWNVICLVGNGTIIYYLLRHERHANAACP